MAVRGPEPPHDEVVRLYAEGWTMLQLGTRFRVAPTRVRAILRSEDVEIRRHGPNGRPPRRGPEPPHDEVVRLYVEGWWSLARLADRYQVGAMRVRGILLSEGVTIRSCGEQAPQPKRGPEPPHGELVRLYVEDRWSLARLADRYQVDPRRVRGILLSEGVTIRGPGGQVPKPRRRPEPPHDEVVRLYVEDGWSLGRLAKRYQVDRMRLRGILRGHDVTIRSPGGQAAQPGRGPEPPHDEVVRRYVEDGWSLARLAKHFHIRPKRVRGILLSEDVPIRGPGTRGPSPKRGPEPPHDEAVRLYRAGWTFSRLCDRYRIAPRRLRNILTSHGVTIRPRPVPPPRTGPNPRIQVPPEQARQMAQRYQAGMSMEGIGQQAFISKDVIRRILTEQGITIRPANRTKPAPTVDPDQVIAHYQAGNTLKATAKKFGLSIHWPRKLLTATGIQIRPRGGRPRSAE